MKEKLKYLDAFLKLGLDKMLYEYADQKDLDELNQWLNSDMYKKIIRSKKIEMHDEGSVQDMHGNYHFDNWFNKDHIPDKHVKSLKEIEIKKKLLLKIIEEFKNKKSEFSSNKIHIISDKIINAYDENESYGNIEFLTTDPFIELFFEPNSKTFGLYSEIKKIKESLSFSFENEIDTEGFVNKNYSEKQKNRYKKKREAFRNLAINRMSVALDSIRKISNCSHKSHYSYTYEEVIQMRNNLVKKLNEEFAKFSFKNKNIKEVTVDDNEEKIFVENSSTQNNENYNFNQRLEKLESEMQLLNKQINQ